MKRLIDDPEIARELRTEMERYATEQAQVDLKRVYASLPLTAAAPTVAPQGRSLGSTWSSLSSTTKLLLIAAIGGTSALGIGALRSGAPETIESQPTAALPPGVEPAQHAGSEEPGSFATTLPDAAAQPPSLGSTPPTAALLSADAASTRAATSSTTVRGLAASESLTTAPSDGWRQAAARGRSGAGSASRREIAQLARIKALLEQDPAAARRLIRAAQREFPAGLLVEEREGLDVIALFALAQNDRARANAERFIARYPQSPLRAKLERLIADAGE